MNKNLILIISCLLVLCAVSLVVAYTYTGSLNTEQDYNEGALRPQPNRNILHWSNPRYKNGTMINWEEKR